MPRESELLRRRCRTSRQRKVRRKAIQQRGEIRRKIIYQKASLHRMSATPLSEPKHRLAAIKRPFRLIGELINNSFSRAAKAWKSRDLAGFQRLARVQTDLGADYLTLNIDGTQLMRVTPQDMFDFLP